MAEINLIDKLKKGEKIECKSCHKGYYVPYNTSADKAHSFAVQTPNVTLLFIGILSLILSNQNNLIN